MASLVNIKNQVKYKAELTCLLLQRQKAKAEVTANNMKNQGNTLSLKENSSSSIAKNSKAWNIMV